MSIPLHLITGFLGSGKTTFLMHYLDTFSKGRKIGVIQNEFSSAGMDGKIIRSHEGTYRLLEINNGSVFCVCLLGSFIDSLAAFVTDSSPDEVIMEASGMSDPVSLGQIFQSGKLRDKVYLGHCWTVVDARNFDKLAFLRSRLEHQLRIADTVIINKYDLAARGQVVSVTNSVKKLNPYARIETGSFARISFTGEKQAFKYLPEMENTESCRPDLQSVVIKSSRLINLERLVDFIDSIKDSFIRCKGYVNITGNRKMAVQGSFDYVTVDQVDWFPGVTELVGIGKSEEKNYLELFESYCNP